MKIKSLLIVPGKKVQGVRIPANIKFIKSLIGNELIKIRLDENTIIIADKNAKQDDFNRILGEKIIMGTFLIVGEKKGRRTSLKKRQMRRYINMFKLSKHEKKVEECRNEYLKEYFRTMTQIKQNKYELNAMDKVA